MENYEIGKRIEARRNQLDFTLDDIAKAVGVAKSTIQRYEKGTIHRVKLPVIEAIARILCVDPAWLCGLTDGNSPVDFDPSFLSSSVIVALKQYCRVMKTPEQYSKILHHYSSHPQHIAARIKGSPLKPDEDQALFAILGFGVSVAIELGRSSATTIDEYYDLYITITSAEVSSAGTSPEDEHLLAAYRAASPDDRAIIDNIVRRYTHAAEATRLA